MVAADLERGAGGGAGGGAGRGGCNVLVDRVVCCAVLVADAYLPSVVTVLSWVALVAVSYRPMSLSDRIEGMLGMELSDPGISGSGRARGETEIEDDDRIVLGIG